MFDNAFAEDESTDELYAFQIKPIIDRVFNQGVVTVFAYGQTGSGKTYSMQGLENLAIADLFNKGYDYHTQQQRNFKVTLSMFEIYGGKLYDLLNDHAQLKLLEDKSNKI